MRLSRRSRQPAHGMPLALALAGAVALAAGAALPEEPARSLTVVSWGGAYEAAQRAALFAPFEAETGIAIEVARYDGGLAELRAQAAAGRATWDVIDMLEEDARAACAEGLLMPLDGPALAGPAPDGTSARRDFLEGAFSGCAVAQLVYSEVVAYDDRAFPGVKPDGIADFFDLERFPGKRALRRDPASLLEWALIAEGVQVYDLLSTDRGMRLAFRRLDAIRDHIVWWRGAEEPPDLLASGRVALASGYNGRFFHARVEEGAPISVIWDGQILDYDVWAIAAGSDKRALAERFVSFALQPQRLADLAERISYGPVRRSALTRVGLHAETGVPMRAHMPNAPRRLDRALRRDARWYARTERLRQRRFEQWLAKDEEPTARR